MSRRIIRKVHILDQTEVFGSYEKTLTIKGLKTTRVSIFETNHDHKICYVGWYCHRNTKEVVNVISSILGKNKGFAKESTSKCDRILESLTSAFEALGHEVVYEKASES